MAGTRSIMVKEKTRAAIRMPVQVSGVRIVSNLNRRQKMTPELIGLVV